MSETEPNKKRGEYGDWQTNLPLAISVCEEIKAKGLRPQVIVEPTCGQGNFIIAALLTFDSIEEVYGIEIYKPYLELLEDKLKRFGKSLDKISIKLYHESIFDFDFNQIKANIKGRNVLILGNPPWVTNSKLSEIGSDNLPAKTNFKKNKGLARGFMAGLDACLRNGADIIVNTDADNQYCGDDIETLVRPILDGRADIVIGERPIDNTEHFSPLKKKLQHLGSWTVRVASNSDIPDAPSGFRAYSREAAMRLNVTNEYTYTLETIIQAGHNKIPMESVPVRTNPELRESRLFSSMFGYVRRSMITIIRSFMMYRPLKFFMTLGIILFILGLIPGIRFLVFLAQGKGGGHVQSLILASTLMLIGVQTMVIGLQADVISSTRKILEDVQYHVRKLDYDQEHDDK